MEIQGTTAAGAPVSAKVNNATDRALGIFNLGSKYEADVLLGRVFSASNQAAVAITAALATTYTGLCLYNPATSGKNAILLGFGYSSTIAVPTATSIGIMSAAVVTTATMTAAAVITAKNRLIGSTVASSMLIDDDCTLNGTPTLDFSFSTAFAEAVTAGTIGPNTWIDLNGNTVLKPGSYVAAYSATANSAAFRFSFLWKEVDV